MTKKIEEKTYNEIIRNVVATRQGTTVILSTLFQLVLCAPYMLWSGFSSCAAVSGLVIGLQVVVLFVTELQFFTSPTPIRIFLSAAVVHCISAGIVTLSFWGFNGAVSLPFVMVVSLVASMKVVLHQDWLEISYDTPKRRTLRSKILEAFLRGMLMSAGLVVLYDVSVLLASLFTSSISRAGFTSFKAGTVLLFGWRVGREASLIIMAELIDLSPLPLLVWCLRLHSNSEHVYRKYITQLALKDLKNLVREKDAKRRVEIYEGNHLAEVMNILIGGLTACQERLHSAIKTMPTIRTIVQKQRSQLMLDIIGDEEFGKFRVHTLITPGELAMTAECLSHLLAKSITDDRTGEVMAYLQPGIRAMIELAISLEEYYTNDCFSLLHGVAPGTLPCKLKRLDHRLKGAIVLISKQLQNQAVCMSEILDAGSQKKLDRIWKLYNESSV